MLDTAFLWPAIKSVKSEVCFFVYATNVYILNIIKLYLQRLIIRFFSTSERERSKICAYPAVSGFRYLQSS